MKLLLVLALVPMLSFAASDDVNPQDREDAYQFLCVPGSDVAKKIPAEEMAENIEQRAKLHAILAHPEEELGRIESRMFSGTFSEGSFGAMIEQAIYCAAILELDESISSRGCQNEAGESFSSKRALAECERINARVAALKR